MDKLDHFTMLRRRVMVLVIGVSRALWLVLLLARVGRADTEINVCGQSFSGTGYLTADLDCSSFDDTAIVVTEGTLDLRGFTVTGSSKWNFSTAVYCDHNCKVISVPPGGTITGASNGIAGGENVRVSDVNLVANVRSVDVSIYPLFRLRAILERVSVVDGGRIRAGNVRVTDSDLHGAFISALKGVKLIRTTLSDVIDPEPGVLASRVSLVDSTLSDNAGNGVQLATFEKGRRICLLRSAVERNGGTGLFGDVLVPFGYPPSTVRIKESRVVNNRGHGIYADRAYSRDSDVSGNGSGEGCGTMFTCADIASIEPPRVKSDTTCDHSYQLASGFPGTSWGVCGSD